MSDSRKRRRSPSTSSDDVESGEELQDKVPPLSSSSDNEGRRPNKKSRKEGKVLERLTKQVSDIQNFLARNIFPPGGWYYPENHGVPIEPEEQSEAPATEQALNFDFELITNLKEPTVARASPEHLKLLSSLQHFQTENWTNVRYSEIQKTYNARPGFVDLEANDEIKQFEKTNYLATIDKSLGAITRAVIMQSDALKKGVSDLLQWTQGDENINTESLVSKIKEIFSGDFQKVSLDCLQLICGRRADIIEQRREIFINQVKDRFLKSSLKRIPPSYEYLFDKDQLADFIKNNGGISKIFAFPKSSFSAQEKRVLSGSQAAQPGPSSYSQAGRSMAPLNLNRYPPPQSVRPFYSYPNYEFPAYHHTFRPQFKPQTFASRQQTTANARKPSGRQGPHNQTNSFRGRGKGDRKY